jgi:voltage-gated potassium channel
MRTDEEAQGPMLEKGPWQAYFRRRYAILFYALLLTLIAMSVVTALDLPALLIRVVVGACLLAAVMPTATKRTRRLMLMAVLLLVLAQFVPDRFAPPQLPLAIRALIAVTGLVAATAALRFAVTTARVSSETVYAALSTYLLAGTFFGQIYWLIESAHPKSVVGPDPFSEFNAVYYSFITLATLGYGDYVPRTAITRGIATFEVIGGQLFLAVLVARLIGVFGSKES